MTSTNHGPWEKACPVCEGTGWYPDLVYAPLECDRCDGTGAVPMTTHQMLEALKARHPRFVLFCDAMQDSDWGFGFLDGAGEVTSQFEYHDPDDALRAALEAAP